MNATQLLAYQRRRADNRYAGSLSRWLDREYKTVLSSTERSVIYGSLFGDGHLEKSSVSALNYRYTEDHSIKEKGYLKWKEKMTGGLLDLRIRTIPKRVCSECNRMVNAELKCPRCNSKRFNIIRYPICELRSGASPLFTILHNKFYSGDIKILNKIVRRLGALGLAVIYMDDGNLWVKEGSYWIEIYLMDMPVQVCEVLPHG